MKTTSEIKAIKDLTTEELAEVIDSIGDEYEEFSTFAIERLAERFVSKQGKVLEVGTIWYVSGYDLNEDAEIDNTQYCVISNNRYVSVTNGQIFATSDRFLAFTGTKQEAQFVANKVNGEVFDFEKVVVKSNTKIGKDGGEVELDSELIIKQKGENEMTNEQIEQIMEEAVRGAYASQSEETLSQLGSVDDAVQSAIDGIDFSEVDGMTEKEAYDFYFDWTLDGIKSVL